MSFFPSLFQRIFFSLILLHYTDVVTFLLHRVCTVAQVIYGSVIVHRVRKGFYGYHLTGDNNNNVTYDSAENGIKMESQPVPVNTQYR